MVQSTWSIGYCISYIVYGSVGLGSVLELRTGGGIGYALRRACLEETQHTLYKQSSECETESPCIRMRRFGLESLLHTHLVAGYSMAALQTVWEG